MILINGQWQGGGKIETCTASQKLKEYLEKNNTVECANVNRKMELKEESGIKGCRILYEQIRDTIQLLKEKAPKLLTTVGGGCDADTASIAYLNALYEGDLAVVWMDGHGDINAPSESESHLFYGMPLRALLGDCPPISDLVQKKLSPDQIILFGSRELDQSEQRYIADNDVSHIPVMQDSTDMLDALHSALKKSGRGHVYIHLDLDVLDPGEFPDTPLPAMGRGYAAENILKALKDLMDNQDVVGTGIFEFKYNGNIPDFLKEVLKLLKLG